jgi:hypothetical protein
MDMVKLLPDVAEVVNTPSGARSQPGEVQRRNPELCNARFLCGRRSITAALR